MPECGTRHQRNAAAGGAVRAEGPAWRLPTALAASREPSDSEGSVSQREQAMLGITVGMDGSENSRRALRWAMREAAVRHCELTVLTVHETVASFWTGDPVTTHADEALQHKAREAAVDAVTQEESRLGEARPAGVQVRAVTGFAARELLDASGVTDLLVIGARGGSGFHRLALGSVSSQVVHHADCPVVVVPGPDRT